MTDTASSRLPEDIIQFIANKYFTLPEFIPLILLNRAFNQALSSKDFLSSLYSNLRLLNKSLPPTFSSEKAMFDVQMAFKKVKERQVEEIAFLDLSYHLPDNIHRPQIVELLATPNQTIPQMLFRDALLNNLNRCIVDLVVFQNEEIEELTLTGITRFVYSEENANYLKNIKYLTFVDSSIDTLNLENFTEVQELRCREIKLIVVNVSGCLNLKELICDKNKIVNLNTGGCNALEKIRCEENQMSDLDLSGRVALKGVHCEGNQLVNFNAQDCQQLAWLHIDRNPKLNSLNLQGDSRLNRVVKDGNHNHLTVLDITKTPLEKKPEWQSLKARVDLRHSTKALRESQEKGIKETTVDDLSDSFRKMSVYVPSYSKESAGYVPSADAGNKENYRVRKKEQIR